MYFVTYLYGLCISEINDSNDTRDKRAELVLFCYYNVLTLPMKQYSVI